MPPSAPDQSGNLDDGSVADWLASIQLEKYAEVFEREAIDADLLSDLTSDDLKEMGIPLGDRKRLLKAIADRAITTATRRAASNATAFPTGESGAERRQITIIFCDLVGYTELAGRLDPEDVGDAVRTYQAACSEVIERWDGYIAKFLGDGVLAYFGWPRAHEDDAERAVRAGLDLCATVARQRANDGTFLNARVGVATGLVMVGELIGEGVAQQEAVFGATPNLAARLQSIADPGRVAIAPSTRELIGDLFELTDLGRFDVKGFSEPLSVHQVDRAAESSTRFEARSGRGLTPFVGRDEELNTLRRKWDEAGRGNGSAVLITGEAGIGKSRLATALVEYARQGPHQILKDQCSPYHSNSALHPVTEQFTRFARIDRDDSDEVRLAKLTQMLRDTIGDDAETVAIMATLLSIPFTPRFPALSLGAVRQRERTIEIVNQFALRLSRAAPVLLVLEDAHWSDPTTLDALERLLTLLPNERVLAVITARPGFERPWLNQAHVAHLDLTRVPNAAAHDIVARVAGGKAFPSVVADRIVATADGVPLFVEELTRTVIESGQLVDRGDRFELSGSVVDLAIPATLRDSLAARVDRLGQEKDVAQVAAAIGRTFPAALLGRVIQEDDERLERRIARLVETGVFDVHGSAAERRLSFRHALIQEVAYRSLLKASRKRIHERIAAALEQWFLAETQAHPETLGFHLAEAGFNERAAEQFLMAAGRALNVSAPTEALAHLNRGLDLVRDVAPGARRDLVCLRLYATLGTAWMLARGWATPEVETAYKSATELSYAASDTAEAVWILWGAWVHSHVRGRLHEAKALSERIRAVARTSGDPEAALIADMIALQEAHYAGRLIEAEEHRRALESNFRPERHRALINQYSTDLQLVGQIHRAIALWILGQPDDALALAWQAESLARSLAHPYSMSWCLTWGALPYLLRGELDELERRLAEGVAIATSQGFAYTEALGVVLGGWLVGERGDLAAGLAQMESGLSAFTATGAEIAVPFFLTLKAELLSRAGRHADALAAVEQALAQVERWGEAWQRSEIHRVKGDILLQMHEPEQARDNLRLAMEIARKQCALGWQLRAATSLARLDIYEHHADSALATLGPVLRKVEQGASTSDVRSALNLVSGLEAAVAANHHVARTLT